MGPTVCEAASLDEILCYYFVMKKQLLNGWASEEKKKVHLGAWEIQGDLRVQICQLCVSLLKLPSIFLTQYFPPVLLK